jgi:hypothetical protein
VKIHEGSAAEWFDQFPPLKNAGEWPAGSQWCPRHWAPCPLFGANGIGASTELMQVFLDEISSASHAAANPETLNREMAEASPLCCRLGDERIYEIWGHWPPSQPATEPEESA